VGISRSNTKEKAMTAEQLLQTALDAYRQSDGYEKDLIDVAWKMEQIGCDSWSALRKLVEDNESEVEYFLDAVLRLNGIAATPKLLLLTIAARNPCPNVRNRLLELLDEMPRDTRKSVLAELTNENRPDDTVTERAKLRKQEETVDV
jgi:hypothetical protein